MKNYECTDWTIIQIYYHEVQVLENPLEICLRQSAFFTVSWLIAWMQIEEKGNHMVYTYNWAQVLYN
jgi:hypothetical protein